MLKPNPQDFIHQATKDKRKAYAWKPLAQAQETYIIFLEGIIKGKDIKLPKEQLPITCKKCEDLKFKISTIGKNLEAIEKAVIDNRIYALHISTK